MDARNDGARACETDWLIFLDADDELDKRYVEASLAGTGDIRQPMTLGFWADGREDDEPVLIPRRNLADSNYIVIGAMCRRDPFLEVGGFRDYPVMEDWDLWRRMVRAGAKVGTAPEAIYRVGQVEGVRRNTMSPVYQDTYQRIRRS